MALGSGSLVGRFTATTLAVLVALLGLALYAEQMVSTDADAARAAIDRHNALRSDLDALQPPLRKVESLTYRYATSLDPALPGQVLAGVRATREQAERLLGSPMLAEQDPLHRQAVDLLDRVAALERELDQLLIIIGDAQLRFPAMGLLTDEMFPANEEFFSALSVSLDEAREDQDGPMQRQVLETLQALRYAWLQQVSTFRLFVADRSGVFGDPVEASRRALQNLRSYKIRVSELITELEGLGDDDRLGFQQALMVPRMRALWQRWNDAAELAAEAYESDLWRADLPLLRQSVSPLIDGAWQSVAQMTAMLDRRAQGYTREATGNARILSRYIWGFVGLVAVALGLGWLLFERVIRRPLLRVARAMQEEARGGREIALQQVGLRETDTLIDAFQLMREQVRNRQLRIESILDNAGDAIVTIDEYGIIETFNKAAQAIFGTRLADAVGHNVSMLMPEPLASEHDGYLRRYREGGEPVVLDRTVDVQGVRRSGELFPLEQKISELQLNGQRLFIGIMRDISERRQAEQAIERSRAEAEQARQEAQRKADELAALLSELQQAQAQLVESEKMASLGGLVAGIAHEINTPVGIGVTAASSLQERVAALRGLMANKRMKRSDLEQFLERVEEGSSILLGNLHRAAELVQSFKQVAVDQATDTRRHFKLCAYLDEVLLNLHPRLKKTRHQVRIDCPRDLEVDSYPGSLSQVVTNLVTNSLVHGFEDREQGHIDICIAVREQRLIFEYRDDGKGIPAEHLAQVFEPFFTTRRGQGGSGLGLHVVYNIVTRHLNGSIRCSSEPGQGTTFTIEIPYEN